MHASKLNEANRPVAMTWKVGPFLPVSWNPLSAASAPALEWGPNQHSPAARMRRTPYRLAVIPHPHVGSSYVLDSLSLKDYDSDRRGTTVLEVAMIGL